MKRNSQCRDCSLRTICPYVVCRAIMGFLRKRWKNSKITHRIYKTLKGLDSGVSSEVGWVWSCGWTQSCIGLLLLTVTDVSTTSAVVIFRVNVSCMKGHFSWYKLLFGQGKGRIPSGCHGNLDTVTLCLVLHSLLTRKREWDVLLWFIY